MTKSRPPDDSPASGCLDPKDAPGSCGTVLHMADFGHDRSGDTVHALRRYWKALREGRAVPDRTDVTSDGLGRMVAHAFILERIAPGSARLRLAGRHLIDLMGMEVRGMPISALINPGCRGRMSDVLETVFQAPQLAELLLVSPGMGTHAACPARMLLMPLKSDLGDVTRILGCLVADAPIGHPPRRFDIVRETFEPVIAGAPVLEPGAGPVPATARSRRARLAARDVALRGRPDMPVSPRPASAEDEVGPRRRRFRSFGAGFAEDPDPGPAPDATHRKGAGPEDGHDQPMRGPRLVVDND